MKTKKKNGFKLALDVAMSITFALLFNKRVLGGLAFHEIAGIAIGFAVLVHILLNLKYVQKVSSRIFDRSLPHRTRLGYVLNLLLLAGMGFILISGLFISKVIFPNLRIGNENWFKMSHMAVSYLTLVLIGVHIGLHWHWVIAVLQRILHLRMPKALGKTLMLALAGAVVVYGGYQMYTTQFISKLGMVQNVFLNSSEGKPGIGHNGGEVRGGGAENGNDAGRQGRGARESGNGGGEAANGAQQNGRPNNGPGLGKEGFTAGGNLPGISAVSVIVTHFGILGVFAAVTYYADKWITRSRKRIRTAVS